MPQFRIREVADPRVERYRHLNRKSSRPFNTFIAESKLAVARAITSQFSLESILTDERYVEELDESTPCSLPIYVAANELLSQIVGFEFHRGQVASVRRPPEPSLLSLTGEGSSSLIVVCPEIGDPTNLAGIIRNATAFGATGMLLGPTGADPYSRRVVRVSMGNVFRLPIRTAVNLTKDLQQLREQTNYQVVATVLDKSAETLMNFHRASRTALLFGGEGYGLSAEWIAMSDRQVTLPMAGKTDSLNVATASGIFLYQFSIAANDGQL
ncbi:MAG: RNA methyltransferase [Pirellulaceae bacterium]|nr:RNA methyltransferase [Pirellulaceae bacterium]